MKLKTTLAGIAVLMIFIVGTFFFISRTAPAQPAPSQVTFPTSTSTLPSGSLSSNGAVLQIKSLDGHVYSIPDITTGKKADVLGAGTYYHITNNQDTMGSNAQFEMQYGTDYSISIVLLKESLKDSRHASETYVRSLLKLSDQTLCSLNVDITVPAPVNDTYADENLGFSFCPNAVLLP